MHLGFLKFLPLVLATILSQKVSAQVQQGVTDLDLLPLSLPAAYDGLPCGKVFRVATHLVPPFIKIDTSKCANQKCPPEAFGSDGGLTYQFVMKELRDELTQICKDLGQSERIEFDWYLPPKDRTNSYSALEMVCQGSFKPDLASSQGVNSTENKCASSTLQGYRGPSEAGTCQFIGDPTCVSPGPDFAIGAIHVSPESWQKISMSEPFFTFKQLVVKRPLEKPDPASEFLKVYAAFSGELWIYIMVEIIVVWLLFLVTEGPYNEECLEGGYTLYFDCFYWSFTTLLCGVDKDAITVGGKIVFTGHLFFCFILVATYTGAGKSTPSRKGE